ncbi:hypothetical protein [Peribacillus huizhouensis]|uniref:Immunity protein 63 domain-containing protein n=1 Tax=Peribacillus huizhouensis TaxID=1501239 RepID=A0ABR6CL35_9BACI|nr:hypothetical protein [Peribacillus huizhouensis]MBA9025750.1 hypothetical protein [Peribacillus huizhouensis]
MIHENPYITFGADIGGPNAGKVISPHLQELRNLLYKYCDNIYCVEMDSIDPVLRVDGEISYWEFEGCEKLRLSKKNRYITIDVGMPRSRWEGVDPVDIRKYLINQLRIALELMLKRLKKEKYTVNDTELWADFSKVEEEFLLK